mgnify:CR=1 FL=1
MVKFKIYLELSGPSHGSILAKEAGETLGENSFYFTPKRFFDAVGIFLELNFQPGSFVIQIRNPAAYGNNKLLAHNFRVQFWAKMLMHEFFVIILQNLGANFERSGIRTCHIVERFYVVYIEELIWRV